MSTVRMSQNLQDTLCRSYKDTLDKVYKKEPKDIAAFDALYNLIIGPKIKPIMEAYKKGFPNEDPKGFFFESTTFGFHSAHSVYRQIRTKDKEGCFMYDSNENALYSMERQYIEKAQVNGELSTPRSFPTQPSKYQTSKLVPTIERANRLTDSSTEISEILEPILLRIEKNSKINATNQLNVTKFRQFIASFSTLNQALKAYPPLDKLADPKLIAKVHKKLERKRTQDANKLQALDLDEATKLTEVILTASLLED